MYMHKVYHGTPSVVSSLVYGGISNNVYYGPDKRPRDVTR